MEDRTLEGRAYAVLEADGTLTLFRSDEKYEEGSVATTRDVLGVKRYGHVWEVPETGGQPGWRKAPWVISSVRFADGQAIRPTNCREWFRDCESLKSADLSGLDTSRVMDMSCMFHRCVDLRSLDLSGWDTSRVTNMSCTFQNCTSLCSLDLSHWDTSRVTNMGGMFAGCRSLESLDLSRWDVSNATDTRWMFASCNALDRLTLPEGSPLKAIWNAKLARRELDER